VTWPGRSSSRVPTRRDAGTAADRIFGRGGALKSSWYGDCLPSRDFPDAHRPVPARAASAGRVRQRTITINDVRKLPSPRCITVTCCVPWSFSRNHWEVFLVAGSGLITIDFEVGVLLVSAVESSGTSTFASGK